MDIKLAQSILADLLYNHLVLPLRNGNVALREHEMVALLSMTCHVEKDIEETCTILNGCNARSLRRWIKEKGFPNFHKACGDKHYFWLDEILEWKMNHPKEIGMVEKRKASQL